MKFLEELVGLVNMSRSKPKLVSNVEKIAKSSLASYLFGEMAKEKYIITMRGQDNRRLVTPFEELVTESTLNILARSVARSPWLARRAEEKWRQKESDNL